MLAQQQVTYLYITSENNSTSLKIASKSNSKNNHAKKQRTTVREKKQQKPQTAFPVEGVQLTESSSMNNFYMFINSLCSNLVLVK